jgi:hypothetical protein
MEAFVGVFVSGASHGGRCCGPTPLTALGEHSATHHFSALPMTTISVVPCEVLYKATTNDSHNACLDASATGAATGQNPMDERLCGQIMQDTIAIECEAQWSFFEVHDLESRG